MTDAELIHWVSDDVVVCGAKDGEALPVTSPFDPAILKVTCGDCLAVLHAEIHRLP